MKATKTQLAVDIDFDKAIYPLMGFYKFDGCFSGDTKIMTSIGEIPIKDIVENKLKLKVLSYNEITREIEEKPIINWFNNGIKQGLNFRGSKITENHKMYDGESWISASESVQSSVLDNKEVAGFITGMLLGDSHLAVEKRTGGFGGVRLKWATSKNDVQYGDMKAKLLANLCKVSKKEYISGFEKEAVSFTTGKLNILGDCLWKLHTTSLDSDKIGKRKQVIETSDLVNFNDLSLAIWYFDDGSIGYNNGNELTPRIFLDVSRYSEESCKNFIKVFKSKYSVTPTYSEYKGGVGKKLSFKTNDSVFLLWRMAVIASGMMPRKFPKTMQLGTIPPNPESLKLKAVGTKVGGECNQKFTAYDLEIKDNHNYFANGVLVHNCRMWNKDGQALARSNEPHENVFITNKYSDIMFSGFDGELTVGKPNEEETLNRTSSATRKHKWEGEIVWNLFDWVDDCVINLTFYDRYLALERYIDKNLEVMHNHGIRIIPFEWIHSKEEAEAFYQRALDDGYEGAVYRNPRGKHKSGRSTLKENDFLRAKLQSTKEAQVISIYEAMANENEAVMNELGYLKRSSNKENLTNKGMLGGLICKDLETGLKFKVGMGKMKHCDRVYYFNNPQEIIGQIITYASMDKGVKNLPRFPRFINIRSGRDMS